MLIVANQPKDLDLLGNDPFCCEHFGDGVEVLTAFDERAQKLRRLGLQLALTDAQPPT
jgi:hypothetical protein